MKKCFFALALMSQFTFVFAGQLSISQKELNDLNRERIQNGYEPIYDIDQVDSIIQDELDKILEQKKNALQSKKPSRQYVVMPIMEKLGAQNTERENLRQSGLRNALEAIRSDR